MEDSKDTRGNRELPTNRHVNPIPTDGGQLENLDLPADAMITHEKQDAGCILIRYMHKIHRLSQAGGLCTDELHLAIQLELRMDCRFNDKPYVLMIPGSSTAPITQEYPRTPSCR